MAQDCPATLEEILEGSGLPSDVSTCDTQTYVLDPSKLQAAIDLLTTDNLDNLDNYNILVGTNEQDKILTNEDLAKYLLEKANTQDTETILDTAEKARIQELLQILGEKAIIAKIAKALKDSEVIYFELPSIFIPNLGEETQEEEDASLEAVKTASTLEVYRGFENNNIVVNLSVELETAQTGTNATETISDWD